MSLHRVKKKNTGRNKVSGLPLLDWAQLNRTILTRGYGEDTPPFKYEVSLLMTIRATHPIERFHTVCSATRGVWKASVHTIPKVSHGSFFQEQMSNPVSKMAWSCLLPFFPMRADCHWQKLFKDWSAWWLINNPPYGKPTQIRVWICHRDENVESFHFYRQTQKQNVSREKGQ